MSSLSNDLSNDDHVQIHTPATDGGSEMSQTWLYFIMVCVAILIIGNAFCMTANGKCPWNTKSVKYSKVKTISSSDEDLSAVEEIDID